MTKFEHYLLDRYSKEVNNAVDAARAIHERGEQIKRLNSNLKALTNSVKKAYEALDQVMQGPSTFERGRKIAKIANYLENCNFMFGFKKPKKISTKNHTLDASKAKTVSPKVARTHKSKPT